MKGTCYNNRARPIDPYCAVKAPVMNNLAGIVQTLPRHVLLALLLALSSMLAAQTDGGDAAAPGTDAAESALEISRELSQRQQAIENMQSEHGIYAPALMEAYGDLAAFHYGIEDYENAVRVYNEALQIARINTGLYGEAQLPWIAALIDGNGKLEDWREVDDLHELDYHIASRRHARSGVDYLAAAQRYGKWKLRLVRENLLDLGNRSLVDATGELSDFYGRIIDSVQHRPESNPESLLPLLLGKTEADLTLARQLAGTPYTAFEGRERRVIRELRCRQVLDANGNPVRRCAWVEVQNPRYRQSQRDAKQFAIQRTTRAIERSIDQLALLRDDPHALSGSQRQQLAGRIAELQTETAQLSRASRRIPLF